MRNYKHTTLNRPYARVNCPLSSLKYEQHQGGYVVLSEDMCKLTNFNHTILVLFTFAVFSGCSPRTSVSNLPVETPEAFSDTGEVPLEEEWWTSFGDEQLNRLVATALDSSFTLLSAWQRVKVANAVVDRETSSLWPQVDASAQSGLSRPEPDFVGGENVRLGITASYEVDLWGRLRSAVRAERFRSEATYYDYQTAAITLAADVALTWYRLQASWNLLQLTELQISTNEDIIRLIRARFGIGQIRGVDILRQEQLLEATLQRKHQLEAQIGVLENQLAVLLGQPPQQPVMYEPDSLPELPPVPETGLPAELVERRPDVRQSFSLLEAADQEVASAISSQYPRINLSTTYALRSNNFQDLWTQWAYSLAGGLTAPLFYGGRLSAEVDRTKAFKQQRLYEYGQTVLVAFQEVGDALVQEQNQLEVIASLEDQVELSTRAYEQLRIEYFNGFSDYLAVLTELTTVQQLQRDLVNARITLIEFRIALYRALAGGFETDRETNSET